MPDRDTVWTAETKGPLTPTSPVVLSWDNGQGLVFRRTITLDDNYMFTIADEVENKYRRGGHAVPIRADLAPRHAEGRRHLYLCTRA